MKRSELHRRTPLEAKTPLQRTSSLNRSPLAARQAGDGANRSPQPKRNRDAGPSVKVRSALAARSGGMCEIAVAGCTGVATDLAHRKKVGAGGRKGSAADAHHVLSNALHACRACHEFCHSYPAVAYWAGHMLREQEDPTAVSVVYRGSRRWLADDGSVLTTPPTPEEATHGH